MNQKIINISLLIVVITFLVFLGFRVSFEQLADPGCCDWKNKECITNKTTKEKGR